jgi:large subunit ribosomal protein L6
MSRVGRKPIAVPKNVTVQIFDNNVVEVKGPKGTLKRAFHPEVSIKLNEGVLTVERSSDSPFYKAIHGTTRALLNNMITGVVGGFKKKLLVNEKTYKAAVNGKNIELLLGYSHPIILEIPTGLEISVDGQSISVTGIDKELVGAFSQKLRHFRKVDPYKAKGIIYEGERIRRKAGKTVASGAK